MAVINISLVVYWSFGGVVIEMVPLIRDVERRDGRVIGVVRSSPLYIPVVFLWKVMAGVDMVCVRTCSHSNFLFLFIDKKNRQLSSF